MQWSHPSVRKLKINLWCFWIIHSWCLWTEDKKKSPHGGRKEYEVLSNCFMAILCLLCLKPAATHKVKNRSCTYWFLFCTHSLSKPTFSHKCLLRPTESKLSFKLYKPYISHWFCFQNKMPLIFQRIMESTKQMSHGSAFSLTFWINVFIQIGWPLFTVPVAIIHALNPLYKKRLMMLTLSYSAAVSKMATVSGQAGKVAHSLS